MKLPGGTAVTPVATVSPARSRATTGVLYGLATYLAWGIVPLYFLKLKHVPPMLVLSHRIIWSVVFLGIVTAAQRRFREVLACVRSGKILLLLSVSTIMIAINWYVFIWSVSNRQVTQASLGYFINPLVSMALGVIFLSERMRLGQFVAILIAAGAVIARIFFEGHLPVVALTLAASFGTYGLIRKVTNVPPLVGLLVETLLLFPVAVIVALRTPIESAGNAQTYTLLVLAGVVTAVPLLWFAAAARRLRLATMGFLQYIAPSCQFLIGTFVNGESISRVQMWSFAGIWFALVIYSIDSLRAMRAPMVEPEP